MVLVVLAIVRQAHHRTDQIQYFQPLHLLAAAAVMVRLKMVDQEALAAVLVNSRLLAEGRGLPTKVLLEQMGQTLLREVVVVQVRRQQHRQVAQEFIQT